MWDASGVCVSGYSGGTITAIILGIVVGGILSAAFCAFLGYILDIGVSIDTEVGCARIEQMAAWEGFNEVAFPLSPNGARDHGNSPPLITEIPHP